MADPSADYVHMDTTEYTLRWEERWQKNYTPWDLGEPAPALIQLFDKNMFGDFGEALVPGCGSGYDVIWVSKFKNWKAVGLDVSQKAIQIASKSSSETCKFIVDDFFTFKGQYDLVFDHLFLCALRRFLKFFNSLNQNKD